MATFTTMAIPDDRRAGWRHQRTKALDFEGCKLTDREAAVVQRVREGMTNAEIARDLGLAVDTVRTHLRSAVSKARATARGA